MQKVWNMADQIPVAPGSAKACPVFADPRTVTKELKIPAWCGDASGHAWKKEGNCVCFLVSWVDVTKKRNYISEMKIKMEI